MLAFDLYIKQNRNSGINLSNKILASMKVCNWVCNWTLKKYSAPITENMNSLLLHFVHSWCAYLPIMRLSIVKRWWKWRKSNTSQLLGAWRISRCKSQRIKVIWINFPAGKTQNRRPSRGPTSNVSSIYINTTWISNIE